MSKVHLSPGPTGNDLYDQGDNYYYGLNSGCTIDHVKARQLWLTAAREYGSLDAIGRCKFFELGSPGEFPKDDNEIFATFEKLG